MEIKKIVLLLGICVVAVFSNSLVNGFVGDDSFLIEHNTFFQDVKNVKYIFSRDYLADGNLIFNYEVFSSGSVAYRPVLSLSYFFDDFLWEKNPLGYHLQNLFWHLLNSILVFLCFYRLGNEKNVRLAFFSSLLFAIHPLRTEAVCAIGYRADLLATFFVLLSLYLYTFVTMHGGRTRVFYIVGMWLAFFLGVFSKESAIILPLLIVGYEVILRQKHSILREKIFVRMMVGYAIICAGYLVVYFYVFPNNALTQIDLMGEGISGQIYYSFKILGYYIRTFFCPWMVKTLPPVFSEDFVSVLSSGDIWFSIFFCAVFFGMIFFYQLKKISHILFFSLFWFIVAYLPVSNIFPLLTPMAHRYIYLPSIGLSCFLAWMLLKIGDWCSEKRLMRGSLLMAGFCLLCALCTFSLNTAWKNKIILARHMVRDFPDNPRGYFFSGIYFADYFDREQALENFEKARLLGLEDPRLFLLLGETYEAMGRRPEARELFRRGIELYPQIYLCYTAFGRSLLFDERLTDASIVFNKTFEIKQNYIVAVYLIQTYRLLGQEKEAGEVYEKMKGRIPDKDLQICQEFLDIELNRLPIFVPL